MKTKRGAISLSMNVLVVIIISLVIFGWGIAFLYKLVGGAEEIKKGLDARTAQELDRLLIDQGQKVALPLHQATVERGESHVFGVGIRNIGDEGDQFRITLELVQATDAQGQDITAQLSMQELGGWFLYNSDVLAIGENEHRKEPLLVQPVRDAVRGEYVFKVRIVTSSGKTYGNPQTFIVDVV